MRIDPDELSDALGRMMVMDSCKMDSCEMYDLQSKVDWSLRTFCDECEEAYTSYEIENYWGAPCRRPEVTCPADLEPEDRACEHRAEFLELKDAEIKIQAAINQLEEDE